ncbi:MAG: conjugal transfer protein TraF [Novosphingobium sp.]|nr:conjugal transfer protein TraF [Novosphingobium sp.]
MINASPSLPYWAIWLDRTDTPARGDLIVFMPPRSDLVTRHFGAKPLPFGKRVLGVAGDRVTEKDRAFFVNGVAVARAKAASRLGEPLPLGPTGTIPKDCYFVGSEHKDGFDSRYAAIGWICRPQVIGVGRPIL